MVEEGIQASRDNLIAFLDFVAEKGLMKRQTAMAYRKACNVILKILDESEVNDLSKINLEAVFRRHRNLAASRILPATLTSYEARTRAAIDGFIEYVKDPSSWKPSVQQRTRRSAKPAQPVTKSKIRTPASKTEEIEVRTETSHHPSIHVDFQIHISPESTPEQIDKIFESMSRHFGSRTG